MKNSEYEKMRTHTFRPPWGGLDDLPPVPPEVEEAIRRGQPLPEWWSKQEAYPPRPPWVQSPAKQESSESSSTSASSGWLVALGVALGAAAVIVLQEVLKPPEKK